MSIASLLVALGLASPGEAKELARHDFPYQSHYVEVMGSRMHYVDTGGDGSVVVMIHGQPTWSYLWRNVIPHVEKNHRVIALDLIGFGKSDKPDIGYTAPEHAQYLAGFVDALALDDITLVIHDWGSVLGFDYAAKHPDRVKAIAFMEAAIWSDPVEPPYGPVKVNDPSENAMQFFGELLGKIKTPGVGEKMILEDNYFIENILLPGFDGLLTEDEKNAYREPFADGKNRLPMLQFPREVPIDGQTPAHTVEMMMNYNQFLRSRKDLPKLLLHLSDGFLIGRWDVEWMRRNYEDLTIHNMGPGGHFMQEYNPDGIGQAIAIWMDDNGL
ncbi:MAG: haloalkane dehalogenase [Alphaproteobacteria bacterium]|nr:haloalkane dehalogenase [Alphaproteobacteria bacterium]